MKKLWLITIAFVLFLGTRCHASDTKAAFFGKHDCVRHGQSTSLCEVKRGDTLWGFSAAGYGHGNLYGTIKDANPKIVNENLIYAGDHIIIPDAPSKAPIVAARLVKKSTSHPTTFMALRSTVHNDEGTRDVVAIDATVIATPAPTPLAVLPLAEKPAETPAANVEAASAPVPPSPPPAAPAPDVATKQDVPLEQAHANMIPSSQPKGWYSITVSAETLPQEIKKGVFPAVFLDNPTNDGTWKYEHDTGVSIAKNDDGTVTILTLLSKNVDHGSALAFVAGGKFFFTGDRILKEGQRIPTPNFKRFNFKNDTDSAEQKKVLHTAFKKSPSGILPFLKRNGMLIAENIAAPFFPPLLVPAAIADASFVLRKTQDHVLAVQRKNEAMLPQNTTATVSQTAAPVQQ